jgi:peptidoglycan/LPS O-acetylase OafA/YrhL
LVVVHHVAISYGSIGSWFYVEPRPVPPGLRLALSVFDAFNQFFFMGFFFFLAGCFAPSSLERKGVGRFALERVVRLGIPLFVFVFGVYSWVEFIGWQGRQAGRPVHWWPGGEWRWLDHLGPGPLWFVEALFVLSLLYAGGRAAGVISKNLALPRPSLSLVARFSIALALLSFAARFAFPVGYEFWRFQLGFFPQYLLLFAGGIASRRARFVEEIPVAWLRPALVICAACALALAVVLAPIILGGAGEETVRKYRGGPHWQSGLLCLIEAVECPAAIIALVLLFRDRVAGDDRFFQFWGVNSYAVYIIHAPIAVGLAVALRDWEAPVLLKFAATSVASVAVCAALSHWVIRRIPGAKRVFG